MIELPQRIVLYLPSLNGGGAERSMLNLARGFAEQGICVDLLVATSQGDYGQEVPAQVTLVDLGEQRVWRLIPKLASYFRTHRPDVVLSRMYRSNTVVLLAASLARVPSKVFVIIDCQTSIELERAGTHLAGRVKSMADQVLMRSLYPRASAIVAVSRGVGDDLARLLDLPGQAVRVIYNPIEIATVRDLAAQPAPHPWLEQDTPVLVAAGRLCDQKDYPTLLRALKRVVAERPVRLIVLGKGEREEALRQLAADLGVADQVDFHGFAANPFAFMARAKLFVLSSAWEGLGNVLIEAMAVGTPVVSTDCPNGPREILEDGTYGPLVPVGDDEALAQAIVQTLDHPVAAQLLRARAQAFDRAGITQTFLEMFARARPFLAPIMPVR